jgi:hypothetical protein
MTSKSVCCCHSKLWIHSCIQICIVS